MDRLQVNDLLMSSIFNSLRETGHSDIAQNCEKVYEKQRAVIEAEEITKEVKP